MNKAKPVVSRTESGRYQLRLSQGQCQVLALCLHNTAPLRGQAAQVAPYFYYVMLGAVLKRVYKRTVTRLLAASAKGLVITLAGDELAAIGEAMVVLKEMQQYGLITPLFAPIHQILS